VRVRVPAQDVILSRSAPTDISALNVLPVTIAALERGAGPGVAVALTAGDARLLARVTKRSCDVMGLAVGDQIFAILKATAIAPADVG
jgi:molybdate transport system ATP-binding protein